VFPSDLVTICSLVARAGGSEDEQVQAMADRIVQYAQACMRDRKRVSPFERRFLSDFPRFSWPDAPVITGEAAREGMFFRGGVRTCYAFMETFTDTKTCTQKLDE
jgi:protein phosphatase PTC7